MTHQEIIQDRGDVTHLDIIPANEPGAWMRIVKRCGEYDFYHLPEYHVLSEPQEKGSGMLFAYQEGDAVAAWPFIVREIAAIDGLATAGAGHRDMTSVYGYPGPVWNARAVEREGFIDRFQKAVEDAARGMHVVCMFSRMSPVLGNAARIGSVGMLEKMGQTVSIDLTEPEGVQVLAYRKGHREGIRSAVRQGCEVFHDATLAHYATFIALYYETMTRVGADARYFFSREYFEELRASLGSHLQLFIATCEGEPCSAGLFIRTGTIVQFHLAGSTAVGLQHAGSKLVVDEARRWATAAGAHYLHLGGGVGSKEDGLFAFKSGFSDRRHDFLVWKNILQPALYQALVFARRQRLLAQGLEVPDEHFFPAYRANAARKGE